MGHVDIGPRKWNIKMAAKCTRFSLLWDLGRIKCTQLYLCKYRDCFATWSHYCIMDSSWWNNNRTTSWMNKKTYKNAKRMKQKNKTNTRSITGRMVDNQERIKETKFEARFSWKHCSKFGARRPLGKAARPGLGHRQGSQPMPFFLPSCFLFSSDSSYLPNYGWDPHTHLL